MKVSGLLRDGLPFYFIGISGLFDTYVHYLTFPAIITAFALPFINLWLVPMLSKQGGVKEESYIKFFFFVSLAFAVLNIFISFTSAFFIHQINTITITLIFTSTLILIFTICSEVLASKIISNGRFLHKMYFGNIFVNVPVIIYLLLLDATVIGLAIISSLSYVVRFIYLLIYSEINLIVVCKCSSMKEVFKKVKGIELIELKKMMLGPLFQSVIYFGRFFCGFLPTGSTSIYFYSLKLFDAFKGTLLFVALTKFFSLIQKESLDKALQSFLKFSCINVFVTLLYVLSLGVLSYLLVFVNLQQEIYFELENIISLSYVTVPLCFLYPGLVFYQRLIVSFRDMEFSFRIFMSLPLTVLLSVSLLYLLGLLSVNYIISSISLALVLPNLYIYFIVYKKLKSLRC
ncbi:hypothetical protein ATS75_10475 [Pseudoalteromonas sp. H105]|nr:hypothetical protein ATS75_10475 [Pseudoalteromonas sp. H105]